NPAPITCNLSPITSTGSFAMSTRTKKQAASQGVHPIAVAIAVVALVAFVGWLGLRTFGGPPTRPLPPPPTADINFVKQKAHEVQGDFKKLSPEDQKKVQQITHGWGVSAIASDWRKEKEGR